VTPGPYTIEQLARDVMLLLDALSLESCHFCGLSVGGLVGMWLGAHAPERVLKLVLCNTAARIGSAERWNARIESVRVHGIQGIALEVLERWFMPAFRTRRPELFAAAARMLETTAPDGYTASCAAIRDADLRASITRIHAPTLVIAGSHDPATPPAEGRWLADAIRGARYVELPASHISNLEAPEQFNAELVRFLTT
jgi:3-oxoadipate enol-lactonase